MRSVATGERPFGRRVLKLLFAAVSAIGSELILIGLSPGIALVPAFAAAIPVAIFHGTDDGIAYVVWLAVGAVSLPVIWLAGAIAITTGIRRTLTVPLLVPLLGAISPPALIIALIATGEAETAIELIGMLREIARLRRLAE